MLPKYFVFIEYKNYEYSRCDQYLATDIILLILFYNHLDQSLRHDKVKENWRHLKKKFFL